MEADAPSRTAEYMALFRALESAAPARERLFEDPLAERFLGGRLRAAARAAHVAPLRGLVISYIDRRYPGPRLSGVVRTRVIDDLVQAALEQGASQLVLLGAGYDTRASRLPAARAAQVFEVDHPATQARKRSALRASPDNVRYVPIDFEREQLLACLERAGVRHEQRTCFVWEGVFSYLSPAAIDATLAGIVAAGAPGSVLILTYVDQRAIERPQGEGREWIAAVGGVGEPFQTGLAPAQASEFFKARGLALLEDESSAQAALRLGVRGADGVPSFYRLARLEVRP